MEYADFGRKVAKAERKKHILSKRYAFFHRPNLERKNEWIAWICDKLGDFVINQKTLQFDSKS